MIYFNCDYNEGAHERIIRKLAETNLEQTVGYGEDPYCDKARALIKAACEAPEADVHFLVGGTQTNMTVISSALRPHQGVMSAVSGHINVHETGAIESTGHKVLVISSEDGKVSAKAVEDFCLGHINDETHEHMVQPKMVYISQSTELGSIYYKKELEDIAAVCRKYSLYLYMDGARMGYALNAVDCDMTLADIARLCDVFYIGGTKVGALFGEAVVITNPALKEDFRYMIKQKGGMFAKGRLLGLQFQTLFEDGLYMELGAHADKMADRIRRTVQECGLPLLAENQTNMVFPIIPDSTLAKITEKYNVSYWERVDDTHSAIRLCTSWATSAAAVEELCADLKSIFAE